MIKNRYQFIKRIIDYCEEFESESDTFSVLSFAEWLIDKNKDSPKFHYKLARVHPSENGPGYDNHIRLMDPKQRLLDLVSRLSRFHDFYLRKFLEDLPVNTRLEYLFLMTIQQAGSIRKSDVIQLHLVEFSTGMDIIRRLMKQGSVTEETDQTDKRTKLLSLTDSGKVILTKAIKKAEAERKMFFSAINENKWKKIIPVLEELHDFHNDVYHKHYDKSEAELRNLIASLKYFYK